MEFALVVRDLLSRWRLLALGVVIAVIVAVLSVYRPDGLALKSRSLVYSAASTQAFIDSSSSVLGNTAASTATLQTLASVYANFMASPTVLAMIGSHVGLHGSQIYAAGPLDPNVPRTVQEPTDLQRNVELTGENTPYRLGFTADPNLPQVGIYAQAPTTKLAVALANASVVALQDYVTNVETADKVPADQRVVIRQLGSAIGSVVDSGIAKSLAGLVFVAVFALWCALMLAGSRFAAVWRRSGPVFRQRFQPQVAYGASAALDDVNVPSENGSVDIGRPDADQPDASDAPVPAGVQGTSPQPVGALAHSAATTIPRSAARRSRPFWGGSHRSSGS